jgi:hypothetical protein
MVTDWVTDWLTDWPTDIALFVLISRSFGSDFLIV